MIHVYVGPTLERSAPQLAGRGMRVCPPARHGDLFARTIRDGDTVVLIDGVYHHAPALRHKEILAALDRGVRVIGAASIGALRAAELAPFGMLGVGAVYTAYARGEITGDDEVAVGQSPDGGRHALTWPLVNVRHVLELAVKEAVLDGSRAEPLLAALRAIYYPQRTLAAVQATCTREGAGSFVRWLSQQRAVQPYFGDLKRADALLALRTAHDNPGASAQRPSGVRQSVHFQRWSNAFAYTLVDGLDLSTEDRVLYQQVFDPDFPRVWAAYLEHRSRHPAEGPGRPLAERLAGVSGGGLTADRVFHPVTDLRDEQTVRELLAGETAQDRQSVARFRTALEARRAQAGFSTAAVRDDLTRRLLLGIWQCTMHRFDTESSARGLVNGARAVAAAKRFVPGWLEEAYEANGAKAELSRVGQGAEAAHGER